MNKKQYIKAMSKIEKVSIFSKIKSVLVKLLEMFIDLD